MSHGLILSLGFTLEAAASAYNHTLEVLDKKLSQYIGGNPIRIVSEIYYYAMSVRH